MTLPPPRKFQSPKAGNRPDECEDDARAVYPHHAGQPARIALCDGATESAFARPWAQALTRAFAQSPPNLPNLNPAALTQWLQRPQTEWRRAVPWHRLPWHGEAKARAGAMAALLGLTLSQSPTRPGLYPWQAVAIGDCCLFIVRNANLTQSFPLQNAAQFNNHPPLICSNPARNAGLWPHVQLLNGHCRPGDLIILASDALACWILQQHESGRPPWPTLLSLKSPAQWQEWLQTQRHHRTIRNDDTTLITVQIP